MKCDQAKPHKYKGSYHKGRLLHKPLGLEMGLTALSALNIFSQAMLMLIVLLQQMRKNPSRFSNTKNGLFLQAKVTEEQSRSVAKSEEE